MRPADLSLLRAAATPTCSPDGSTVVWALGGPDTETDEYVSQLWRRSGTVTSQLTFGTCDTDPRYSPDGRWIAFTRAAGEGKPQLWVLPTDGGEARQLTDLPLGVKGVQWSPDSTHLAFLSRVPDAGRYDPDVPPAKEPPRLIDRFQYRQDNIGFLADKPQHLHVVHIPGSENHPVRQLTHGDMQVAHAAWLADSETIAVVGDLRAGRDTQLRADLALVPMAGGELSRIDMGTLSPTWVGAGKGCVYILAEDLGPQGLDFVARNNALYRYDLGPRELWQLTEPEDVALQGAAGAGLVRGHTVYLLRERAGAAELVTIDGGREREGSTEPLVTVIAAPAVVTGFDIDAQATTVVAAVVRAATPGDIEMLSLEGGQQDPVRLTHAGAWCAQWVREPCELTVKGRDGYPIHGWVTVPTGPGPHPAILLVHGGPYAQYTGAFFDETQVYVRAGYAVVQCNPRGSAGYGQAHGRAIKGGFGTVDACDVLDFFDAALADERFGLDAQRTAVMGGSYGGYMSAWLTTQTSRFATAIVERGFLDAVSFVGSSDIGWYFGLQYLGPDAGPEAIAAQNPMAHIESVTTPTLIIHSENDWRCPVEQGQRWFVELKRRSVPTALLLFPGEGHEMSRSGLPSHRVARFEHILAWLDQYLDATRS